MALTEDTWRLGTDENTGLLMGVGTVYEVVWFKLGLGPIVTNDRPLGVLPGSVATRDTQGVRALSLNVEVFAGGGSSMAVNAGALINAWTNGDQDVRLYWRLLGQTGSRYVVGRPRLRGDYTQDLVADGGRATVELDFDALNPQIRLTAADAPANF